MVYSRIGRAAKVNEFHTSPLKKAKFSVSTFLAVSYTEKVAAQLAVYAYGFLKRRMWIDKFLMRRSKIIQEHLIRYSKNP